MVVCCLIWRLQNQYISMNDHTQDRWLNKHEKNVYSQSGEDGVIETILKTLGLTPGFCVEFGAWDGKHLSNTYKLMEEGFSGVFIEGSKERFEDLKKTYGTNPNAHLINAYVGFDGDTSLDSLLAATPIPKDFVLLSIDIDGNDYHVWDSLKKYIPSVVVIEYNPTMGAHVDFVQKKDMKVNQGNSLAALVRLGKEKGYELVATTVRNAFFVRAQYFAQFSIQDNSSETLFSGRKYVVDFFQGYDGTFMFRGDTKAGWHALPFGEKAFQIVPKIWRTFPGAMNPIQMCTFKVWRKIRNLLRRYI